MEIRKAEEMERGSRGFGGSARIFLNGPQAKFQIFSPARSKDLQDPETPRVLKSIWLIFFS